MSENNNKDVNDKRKDSNNRSPSPNPFLSYLSSSPSQISPRSDKVNNSPRSPRFNPNGISNAMLTAGLFILFFWLIKFKSTN